MKYFNDSIWYKKHPLQWVLRPFSWGFRVITWVRRVFLQQFLQKQFPVPIIVVGNISVGGVGKTPLVVELAQQLTQKGINVGIVSRGYGARLKHFPYEVRPQDPADIVGDEPVLIAQKTQCPVVIAPRRNDAVQYLLDKYHCKVIISDDGLQHYKMGRSIEIAVIDGQRGLGNGLCLPAGPLRETKERLQQVDFIVVNDGKWPKAHSMTLAPEPILRVNSSEALSTKDLEGKITAVAGIGNPQRFYSTLEQLGIKFTPVSYPDHYRFRPEDFNFDSAWVIMTEKDAVKCHSFSHDHMLYLPVKAVLDKAFWSEFWSHEQLQGIC